MRAKAQTWAQQVRLLADLLWRVEFGSHTVWPYALISSHVPLKLHLTWNESKRPLREIWVGEDVDLRLRWFNATGVKFRVGWRNLDLCFSILCLFLSLCFQFEPLYEPLSMVNLYIFCVSRETWKGKLVVNRNNFDEGILAIFNWFGFDFFKSISWGVLGWCSVLRHFYVSSVLLQLLSAVLKRRMICFGPFQHGDYVENGNKHNKTICKPPVLHVIHFLLGEPTGILTLWT